MMNLHLKMLRNPDCSLVFQRGFLRFFERLLVVTDDIQLRVIRLQHIGSWVSEAHYRSVGMRGALGELKQTERVHQQSPPQLDSKNGSERLQIRCQS